MARTLIAQSCNYFPSQDLQSIQLVRGNVDLYYNPNVHEILQRLAYADETVYHID